MNYAIPTAALSVTPETGTYEEEAYRGKIETVRGGGGAWRLMLQICRRDENGGGRKNQKNQKNAKPRNASTTSAARGNLNARAPRATTTGFSIRTTCASTILGDLSTRLIYLHSTE